MKKRLTEFLAHLEIGQKAFEQRVGLSNGFVNSLGGNITVRSLNKIAAAYPELNTEWLTSGEGEMLRHTDVSQRGRTNVSAPGAGAVIGEMRGGTFNHNGGKDKVIEKQEREVIHMFDVFMGELRNFREYTRRQDDLIKNQDEHLKEIVKHSYLRNKENMERIDVQFGQQNKLIEMVLDMNKRTQDRADRILDLLEKKL